MSLFSWMFTGRKPAMPPASSGLSRMEATRPARRSADKDAPLNNAQPANRKGERMARRELLYAVVRDAMTRAGVLSSGYKFKVLSLDARGRQFLVMVDLARNHGGETTRLAEIEALIAQGAKARYDILVSAVYWRLNEHVAVGEPKAQVAAAPGRCRNPCRWSRSPPESIRSLQCWNRPLRRWRPRPGSPSLPATTPSRPTRWRLSSERWPTAWPTRPRPRPPQWACHMASAHVPSTAQAGMDRKATRC